MNQSSATMAAWAMAAGVGIPILATLSAGLGRSLGNPVAATMVLCVVALCVATIAATITGGWPVPARLAATPAPYLMGGLFTVFYTLSVTILVPRFGVGNTVLFVLVGQVFAAGAIDHFGLLGAIRRPLASQRLIGLAIFLIGLAVAQTSGARALR